MLDGMLGPRGERNTIDDTLVRENQKEKKKWRPEKRATVCGSHCCCAIILPVLFFPPACASLHPCRLE